MAGYVANFASYPFITVAAGSSTNPFAATPSYSPAGPFQSQIASMSTYAVDACILDFI